MQVKKNIILFLAGLGSIFLALAIFSSPSKNEGQPLQKNSAGSETTTSATPQTNKPDFTNKDEQSVVVTRVIDGDTIEIEGGQKVRYIGINTPETVDPRKPVECFGNQASDKNKKLLEGKKVRLVKDVAETDKYGRLLRYVFIGDIFVNDYLVRQGYAYAISYPPDVRYQNQLREAQAEAQEKNLGLWASCNGQTAVPTSTVSSNNANGQANVDCVVKGNISSSGEKIYHMPGQRYYDKTVIDETKGERWFCTEGEAVSAGWRKSKV